MVELRYVLIFVMRVCSVANHVMPPTATSATKNTMSVANA